MTTFQSQIDILATNIIELYQKIENSKPNNFSLVKLKYSSNSLGLENNPSFQTLPTYVLAMDIDNSIPCEQYDVSLGVYESTIDKHTFQYVVPTQYSKKDDDFDNINSFVKEFIHCGFDTKDGSLKLLFNFPQVISLNSELSPNENYFEGNEPPYLSTTNYSNLVGNSNETIIARNIDNPPQTKKTTEIIKQLRDLKIKNKAQCIDLIDEKLESLIYNNIYEITENGNLILKEHTNHPLKKNMNMTTSEDIYILECDSNTKYLLEC